MTDSEYQTKVKSAALSFRKAIESIDVGRIYLPFSHFPHGTCGCTSLMLGAFLAASGLGDYQYIQKERCSLSHAWLENAGLIVDITSDQFPDGTPVYVGYENPFYASFCKGSNPHLWNASLKGNSIETDQLYPLYLEITNALRREAER